MTIPIQRHIQPDPSPTLHLNERVKELWQQGETVYHLGFGESRFPVHPKLQTALSENAHRKAYLPVQGLPDLRSAVAAYMGQHLQTEFTAEQVIIGPGSKALLFALLRAIDGHLLLPTPSWVSYAPQARLLNKPTWHIPATAESDYVLTVDAVADTVRRLHGVTKILLLNSPNNPTGLMLSPDFLEPLAEFCRQQRIIVISDEIYGLVPHGSQPHVSLSRYYPEGTIVVGGLSKHLSLGGWRLGHAILPADQADLRRALISIGSEIWSSASAPMQYAALTAYSGEADIEAYIAECTTLHGLRSQHIWSWLTDLGIRCAQPQGGFYLMPDFNQWREPLVQRGVTTSEELSRFLLETYRLATLPGAVFGHKADHLALRLSTSFLDMESDEQAESLLTAWRSNPNPTTLVEQHQPNTTAALQQFARLVDDLRAG